MSKRKSKPIPFNMENKRDMRLLDYVENKDVPFASYIKNLIEKDMLGDNSKIDKNEMKEMIVDLLNEMNLNNIKADSTKECTAPKISKTQKTSIKGILNNLNKS